jgi:hypothetical protein
MACAGAKQRDSFDSAKSKQRIARDAAHGESTFRLTTGVTKVN